MNAIAFTFLLADQPGDTAAPIPFVALTQPAEQCRGRDDLGEQLNVDGDHAGTPVEQRRGVRGLGALNVAYSVRQIRRGRKREAELKGSHLRG